MSQVIDTKFISRSVAPGSGYADPNQVVVTGPTLQEYLKQHYRDGWTLFSLNNMGRGTEGGQNVVNVFIVLVKYAEHQLTGSPETESQLVQETENG